VPPGNELYAIEGVDSGERVVTSGSPSATTTRARSRSTSTRSRSRRSSGGRGFGREAMLVFEDEARRRGLTEVNLTVMGGNEVARSLYRWLGYVERAVFMSKDL
jgi:GNAT superfamily N-acetyltransferase